MKVSQSFTCAALSVFVLILIHACNDNRMAPTEPLQVQDQTMLAKDVICPDSKLVFQSWRDGQGEIYVMNADGSGQTNLTNWPYYDGVPAWSHGGEKIVFSSWREDRWVFCTMNGDGSDLAILEMGGVSDPWHPDWSPNAKKIVFVEWLDYGTPEQNGEIYVINVDGTGLTRLTDNPAWDLAPAFSHNGKKIAFQSNREGDFEIYVMNADGSGVTNLTNYGAGHDVTPVWSPNGKKIAFTRILDPGTEDVNPEIFVMNADGSGQTRLTNTPNDDRHPAWSPNGKKIAFGSERLGEDNRQIFVMNADGSEQTNLSNNAGWDGWVDWVGCGDRCDDDNDE